MHSTDQKPCSNCGVTKHRSYFYKSNKTKSGMTSWCMQCYKEAAASKRKSTKEEFDLIVKQRQARADAIASGNIYYKSVMPCKNGHKSNRLVSTHQCVMCLKDRKTRQRKLNGGKSYKLSSFKIATAKNNGLTRYFTGIPCKRGHVSERLISTRQCCQCLSDRDGKRAGKASNESIRKANAKRRSRAGRAKIRIYYRKSLSTRAEHKMKHVMYSMIRRMMYNKAGCGTKELLGYDTEKLMQRIEFQFKDGMSWENHGKWHVDHIKPLARFFEQGETRPHIVNALCNLRPMWAKDNLSKSSNFVAEKQQLEKTAVDA